MSARWSEEAHLAGIVVRGDGRGRRLGFPTANLALDEGRGLLRGRGTGRGLAGVYAARVHGLPEAAGKAPCGGWPAVVNIGARPTFGKGGATAVEVHLLDFEGDLCGRHLQVTLESRLRDERSFGSSQELAAQIARDIEAARTLWGGRGRTQP